MHRRPASLGKVDRYSDVILRIGLSLQLPFSDAASEVTRQENLWNLNSASATINFYYVAVKAEHRP